jgi:hypothetical protein
VHCAAFLQRILQVSLLAFVLSPPVLAHAQAKGCPEESQTWVEACAKRSGIPIALRACHQGRVVLAVSPTQGHAFDVEIRRGAEGAFRSVGDFAVLPVGQFPDWSKEPEARRDAFEALAECVALEAPRITAEPQRDREQTRSPSTEPTIPWLLLVAATAFGLALALRWRRASFARMARLHGWGTLLVLSAACFALRLLATPFAFFHQNGQGPMWVHLAMDGVTSPYGPGYAEVFGWLTRLSADPYRAVFFLVAVTSAFVPALGYGIARRTGATRLHAWILAAALALHPLLARLAQSESYFGVSAVLLFASAAILSWAAHRGRWQSATFLLAVVSAGALLAQAARIHPVAWVPASTLPAVLLLQPGRWRRRLGMGIYATLGIAGIVSLTTIPEGLEVLTQFRTESALRPLEQVTITTPGVVGTAVAGVLLALALLARDKPRAVVLGLAMAATMVLISTTNVLRANFPFVKDAYGLLFAPLGVALLAAHARAMIAGQPPWARRLVAGALVLGMIGVVTSRWGEHRRLSTDALEQSWAQQWRNFLPEDAVVAYLGRAGDRLLVLPLRGPTVPEEATFRAGEPPAPMPATGRPMFYYRSSLCSTEEGKSACEAFERARTLELVDEKVLPARASHPWQPMGSEPIHVQLHRVAR